MKGNNKKLIQNSISTLINNILNNNTNMVYYSADSMGSHIHPNNSNFKQFLPLSINNLNQVI